MITTPQKILKDGVLPITNDKSVMIDIGKTIVSNMDKIYTEKVVNSIMKTIHENMPDASEDEINDKFFQSIYDYWTFGNNVDEEFYYNFGSITASEKQKFLNEKNRKLYIYHLNKLEDAHLLNNKYETYCELKEYYKRDIILLKGEEDFDAFCEFCGKHKSFVVKPTDLALAVGVYKCSVNEDEPLRNLFDRLLNEGNRFKADYQWSNRNKNDGPSVLLEEIIDQDERVSAMHPQSANAIRCTTVRVDGKVHLVHPWLKIGVNGAFVTSGAVGSMLAGINEKTGIVETEGFNEKGKKFEYHPDTNVKIPGFVIPEWQSLLDMLQILGNHYENINYIGWDMVLSKKGWCIMEANFTGECMWQLMYEKGMKQEFEDLIHWKPEKQFWWE